MRKIALVLVGLIAVASLSNPAAASVNASLTPGATNPDVTQATITTTICTVGYTKTVRGVFTSTRNRVYAEYRIANADRSKYVIDHLVPLEVGGSSAIANLWPEAKAAAKRKDQVENELHDRVCAGGVDLASAQRAFIANWHTASATAITTTTSTTSTTTTTTAPPPPPPTEPPTTAAPPPPPPPATEPPTAPPTTEAPVAPGGGATARCNEGTYSYAEHHQGACSSHGGVAEFYK